ncbi:MAG: hypothetical protein ACHREM_15030 [Polyangiales bacterium]
MSASCGYPTFSFDAADAADAAAGDDAISTADTLDATIADVPVATDTIADTTLDTTPEAPLDAGCALPLGGDFCTSIPRFTAAAQVLDGIPDEFCDIPATTLNVSNAQYTAP